MHAEQQDLVDLALQAVDEELNSVGDALYYSLYLLSYNESTNCETWPWKSSTMN